MNISRREFLRYCTLSAAALGLRPSDLRALEQAITTPGAPTVVWLQGSSCCGCSISLLDYVSNAAPRSVDEVLLNNINLVFHLNLMSLAGESAVDLLQEPITKGGHILVVEGGVPTAFSGRACVAWTYGGKEVTFQDALRQVAAKASKIICVGTCASFGGIPAASPNPTGLRSVSSFLKRSTINIPGCPMHPDWFVWTVVQLLLGNPISLDSYSRPTTIYGKTIHSRCPYNEHYSGHEREAHTYGGPPACMKELGCRGPSTKANCQAVRWNNKVNWCVEAGAPCLGCTEPTFPGTRPLYSEGEDGDDDDDD